MDRGIGLMWQITSPRQSLSENIVEACECFHVRFGRWPALITVNEVVLAESGIINDHVQGERMTPPGHIHLWGIPK